jgi:DNA-binding protein HU-beta
MNKTDLINEIAAESGLTKADSKRALDACVKAIMKALSRNKDVTLVGFGTFTVTKRSARKGRNPQTGKEINIPARKVPKFRVGKALKEIVR